MLQIVDILHPGSSVADSPNTEICGRQWLRANWPMWRNAGQNSSPHSLTRWTSSTQRNERFSLQELVFEICSQSLAVKCSGSTHTRGHFPATISFHNCHPNFHASVRTPLQYTSAETPNCSISNTYHIKASELTRLKETRT
jgi:hypothetical protein